MNHHIRSIDSVWEEDTLVVLDPTVTEFRKVINDNQEYIVLFANLDQICDYFDGPTWVYWTPTYFTYIISEDKKFTFLKVIEQGKCRFIETQNGHLFKDEHGFVNGINYPKEYNKRVIVFYEKGLYRDNIPGGSRTVGEESKEYSLVLNWLKQYDE